MILIGNGGSPSRFARNAVANWFAFLFAAAVGFFLSPYVVQQLGATRYGVWSLTAGLVGYIGLLDLGIRQAVNRYTARNYAAGTHREGSLIISAALKLFGFLGIVAILLSGVVSHFAPVLFNIPPALAGEAQTIVILGGLTVAATMIGGVFGGVVTGLERFDISCGLEVVLTTVRTAAFVLVLEEGYGLVALAAIQLSSSVVGGIAYWAAARRLYAQLRIRLRDALGPQMRTILSFSASVTVLTALGQIISYSDNAVIGAFLPVESVTFFAIAASLCAYAKEMPRSLAYLMTPRISALASVGSKRVGDEILAVAQVATLASSAIAVTFMLRGESFIALWMGPAYGPLSGEVLRILAVVVWLEASRSVVINSLMGMAKQRTMIPGVLFEAACNLALSLALVKPFGIVGVALGTLIPNVMVSLGYVPRCLWKATGIPVHLYCRNAVLLPTVACLPFALATALTERLVPATNLAIFFLQTIVIAPLVPVTAWFLCLSTADKQQVKLHIGRMIENRSP
jgi:O-antigen/teichoic acid export membrane protein